MDIYVYIDAKGLTDSPQQIGVLHTEKVRGREIFSFRACDEWIANKSFTFLDADLGQYQGDQYAPEGKENFGIFTDSCPDRWGRILMQRRERLKAKEEKRPLKRLETSDYLLGVYDGNRMGALRFKTSPDGPFLDDDSALATPPMASLRMLEQASLNYERDDAETSPDYQDWVRMLYSPGASLGGARPKANVADADGSLWIAKFPSRNDMADAGAWEYIVTSMAHDFGINTPEIMVGKFSSSRHTFMARRFDRTSSGRRIYFAISNCDDHLRNHGFILSSKGWSLSPVFDLMPNPTGAGLMLNIDESDNALDFGLAIGAAPYYGINKGEAESLVERCKSVCSSWRLRAGRLGISRSEQEVMAPAFKI